MLESHFRSYVIIDVQRVISDHLSTLHKSSICQCCHLNPTCHLCLVLRTFLFPLFHHLVSRATYFFVSIDNQLIKNNNRTPISHRRFRFVINRRFRFVFVINKIEIIEQIYDTVFLVRYSISISSDTVTVFLGVIQYFQLDLDLNRQNKFLHSIQI